VLWLNIPLQEADRHTISAYIDYLQDRRLEAKTINCHLTAVRCFYAYLKDEGELNILNPVGRGRSLRLGQPLPKHLRDQEVVILFNTIKSRRDLAMFMLMLRCGLRVAEVAGLTLDAADLKRSRLYVNNGKGGKGRVVYLSRDAACVLSAYLQVRRPLIKTKSVFLVGEGSLPGQANLGAGHSETNRTLCE